MDEVFEILDLEGKLNSISPSTKYMETCKYILLLRSNIDVCAVFMTEGIGI